MYVYECIKDFITLEEDQEDEEDDARENIEFSFHYDNTLIQYTASFFSCKNETFQLKNLYIFLIFAQDIDCGYTLEPLMRQCIVWACYRNGN